MFNDNLILNWFENFNVFVFENGLKLFYFCLFDFVGVEFNLKWFCLLCFVEVMNIVEVLSSLVCEKIFWCYF